MVDGQYMDELHNPKLKWKGSSNQRVIDVQESLKENKVVLIYIYKNLSGLTGVIFIVCYKCFMFVLFFLSE